MTNWRANAACLHADPDMWFVEQGDHGEEAKHVCNTVCPVRRQCLDYALRHKIAHGIWGGLNSDELRKLGSAGRSIAALCPEGHALTPDNTIRNGKADDGGQAYRCRRCLRERRMQRREARRVAS